MATRRIILTGENLTVDDINAFLADPEISIDIADQAFTKIERSKAFVDSSLDKKVIYGINTGFGPMASYIIGATELEELQYNLIRSHAVGIGRPIHEKYVLAAMIVRLNTLIKGYSGISRALAERLLIMINKRIIPIIPEHGAVGTSGDLVQLAHIALALIGEGEVLFEGKREKSAEVFKRLGIGTYKLQPKEGLALINGTSVMTGISAVLCREAEQLVTLAIKNGAFALELVHGFNDAISEKLHDLRPHTGQVAVAKLMRDILRSSKLLRDRHEFQEKFEVNHTVYQIPEEVQQVYSIRCIPQVLGPVFDTLNRVKHDVEIEMNAVTDNPIVDVERKSFLHGGNFHGDYIAVAIDQLKAGIAKLTMLAERRTNFFLNDKINKTYPPFMNLKKPGLTLGLQGLQFVATSTTAQNQTLAYPHNVHSISTNGDNQDIVSMGTDAALMAAKVIDNAFIVLAIEMITLAQTVDFMKIHDDLATTSRSLYDAVREQMPTVMEDRVLIEELPRVVHLARSTSPLRTIV